MLLLLQGVAGMGDRQQYVHCDGDARGRRVSEQTAANQGQYGVTHSPAFNSLVLLFTQSTFLSDNFLTQVQPMWPVVQGRGTVFRFPEPLPAVIFQREFKFPMQATLLTVF